LLDYLDKISKIIDTTNAREQRNKKELKDKTPIVVSKNDFN
jgi:hypothetical protein